MSQPRSFTSVVYLALVVILAWLIVPHLPWGSRRIVNTAISLQEIKALSQFVTVQYVLEKVIIVDDPPDSLKAIIGSMADNRVVIVAHGIVKAGVDLGELHPGDLQIAGQKITIRLPPMRVFDTFLDDKRTMVMERTTGLLRSFDKDLEQNARVQAVLDINRAARESGILKDADKQARIQLAAMFKLAGFTEVEFNGP